jgi:hypothetical protein
MPRTSCLFQNFEINNIITVNNNKIKKKYTKLKGSLGFSNATTPTALNGLINNKAKTSTKTNRPPIKTTGKTSVILFFFMTPREQKLPIYTYACSSVAQRERVERPSLRKNPSQYSARIT